MVKKRTLIMTKIGALLLLGGVSLIALRPASYQGQLNVPLFLVSDQKRIDMGIKALSNMVQEDGSITYLIDFLTNHPDNQTNMVREMGSTYALAFAYDQTRDPKLKEQLIRIFNLSRTRCVPALQNACFMADKPDDIKVGSTALALLAELFYAHASKDNQFADMREKWMQALIQSYRPGIGVSTSPDNKKTSPYYDGETWFALSVYHAFYPENTQVAEVLASMDDTMIHIYQDQYLISFVHWGLMAGAHRFATTRSDKFLFFLKRQFQLYVAENQSPRRGSSTCSVSEGLGDTAYFVKGYDDAFAQKVMDRIELNRPVIEDLQVLNKEVFGPDAAEFPSIHPGARKYIGAFKNTPASYKTRNDITQHCMIALLKRQRALKK